MRNTKEKTRIYNFELQKLIIGGNLIKKSELVILMLRPPRRRLDFSKRTMVMIYIKTTPEDSPCQELAPNSPPPSGVEVEGRRKCETLKRKPEFIILNNRN